MAAMELVDRHLALAVLGIACDLRLVSTRRDASTDPRRPVTPGRPVLTLVHFSPAEPAYTNQPVARRPRAD